MNSSIFSLLLSHLFFRESVDSLCRDGQKQTIKGVSPYLIVTNQDRAALYCSRVSAVPFEVYNRGAGTGPGPMFTPSLRHDDVTLALT